MRLFSPDCEFRKELASDLPSRNTRNPLQWHFLPSRAFSCLIFSPEPRRGHVLFFNFRSRSHWNWNINRRYSRRSESLCKQVGETKHHHSWFLIHSVWQSTRCDHHQCHEATWAETTRIAAWTKCTDRRLLCTRESLCWFFIQHSLHTETRRW